MEAHAPRDFDEALAFLEALDVHENGRCVIGTPQVVEVLVDGDVGLVANTDVDRHALRASCGLEHEGESDIARLGDDGEPAFRHISHANQVEPDRRVEDPRSVWADDTDARTARNIHNLVLESSAGRAGLAEADGEHYGARDTPPGTGLEDGGNRFGWSADEGEVGGRGQRVHRCSDR